MVPPVKDPPTPLTLMYVWGKKKTQVEVMALSFSLRVFILLMNLVLIVTFYKYPRKGKKSHTDGKMLEWP